MQQLDQSSTGIFFMNVRKIFNTKNFFQMEQNILLIKKDTYQIFTHRKCLEDNLQLIYYLVRTKNVNMINTKALHEAMMN